MAKYLDFARIAAAGNLSVAPGPATLGRVIVGTGAASAVMTIYNNTAGSGEVVAIVDASTELSLEFDVFCTRGIYGVLSGGNADVTVVFS